jgi:hypothetical protein
MVTPAATPKHTGVTKRERMTAQQRRASYQNTHLLAQANDGVVSMHWYEVML